MYNGKSAQNAVDVKYADHDATVAFDRLYISNPDLAFKVK